MGSNSLLYSGYRLLWCYLLLFFASGSCQVKKKPESALVPPPSRTYSYKKPHPDGTGKVYMGREIAGLMGVSGGSWLERNTREQEENTEKAIAAMGLRPNTIVADIGAGIGYYTFRLAAKVPQGKVYAVELQDAFIDTLKRRSQQLGLANVHVVKGSQLSPNLPAAALDLAIMVDVYHELSNPQQMLQAIRQALKPSGKLLLLEYRGEDPGIPIKELHKMRVSQVNKELAANGFRLDKKQDFLPIQHFLLYEKQ